VVTFYSVVLVETSNTTRIERRELKYNIISILCLSKGVDVSGVDSHASDPKKTRTTRETGWMLLGGSVEEG
jgi:hypothetical protein